MGKKAQFWISWPWLVIFAGIFCYMLNHAISKLPPFPLKNGALFIVPNPIQTFGFLQFTVYSAIWLWSEIRGH